MLMLLEIVYCLKAQHQLYVKQVNMQEFILMAIFQDNQGWPVHLFVCHKLNFKLGISLP